MIIKKDKLLKSTDCIDDLNILFAMINS